jgi:hypothetical protein
MRVESMGDMQVIRDEGAEPGLALVDGGGVGGSAEGYVCAAGTGGFSLNFIVGEMMRLRL